MVIINNFYMDGNRVGKKKRKSYLSFLSPESANM